jgi:hypothetical protein
MDSDCLHKPEARRKVIGTNLWGVIHGINAFAEPMVSQAIPALIINTGSKQGITTPPGDTAYNVSKAGVKVATEGLQHESRNRPGCLVSAHLLAEYANKNAIKIFSWICEGVSRSYGFKMFAPGVVRDVLAVGGKIVTNGGARITEEGEVNWESCSERDVMHTADRLGAPFDGFSNDRTYEIYTLDESYMLVPDLSGVPTEMPFRAEDLVVRVVKRPWWKFW